MMMMKRATTLVIEDDRDNRALLVRHLQKCGLLVDSASTVADALVKLATVPKVVLLDLQDGTGRDVLAQIRQQNLPVLVGIVTGSADPEALSELEAFRPDALFAKPVNFEVLCKWVEYCHR